jgi:hypothetical protein
MKSQYLQQRVTPSAQLMNNLLLLTGIGIAVSVVGVIFVPQRMWPNLLLANYYLIGLGVAAGVFIALLYVSNAGWATVIRRIPESMTSVLPFGGIAMLIVMLGIPVLYEWSHADAVQHDHLLSQKTAWLNVPFFVIRTVLYITLWTAFIFYVVRLSLRQDQDGNILHTKRSKTASAIFLVVFGLTFTLASMDWIMSLEPHWYSTIFGIYNFAGTFLNGLATITLLVLLLKRMGMLEHVVTSDHLHNLGKLIFAFSTFWMYIWFSQYLLIWYANIPEEVVYLVHRQKGSWLVFTIVNVIFNWVIPFVALLPAWTKKNEGLLFRICIILMIGHWIDLFWMILPPFMRQAPVVNIWELAPIMASLSGFFYLTFRALSKRNLIPLRDPMIIESLPHHS